MKKSIRCVALVLLMFSGCVRSTPPIPESNFFRDFSMNSVIQKMGVPEISFRSGSQGRSEAFGDPIRRRKNFSLICKITESGGANFDEEKFVAALREEIRKLMDEAKLHKDGQNNSRNDFQLDYSLANLIGSVDVTANRGEGDQLNIWAVIRETTTE